MIRWHWIFLVLLTCTRGAFAEPSGAAPAASPTLDHAIYITSETDRREAYLGEAVLLTLEYAELSVRGLKVQPFYRGGAVAMPKTEGFYAGPLQTVRDNTVRDGALYSVTRYQQRLYPAVAGDLEIGSWRWQGTVNGYTATGPQSSTVDLSTPPISVRIRPLPSPPSTFRGAVGEFELALALSSATLVQGTPGMLTLTVKGSGNPGTLEAPSLPQAEWYTLGDPKEDAEPDPDLASGYFSKPFHYELMPLRPGDFSFSSISFTYFSPAEKQYKVIRTDPISVRVSASGPEEALVVVGGGASGGPGPALMEDGKLALAPGTPIFVVYREREWIWTVLLLIPPCIFMGLALRRAGWRNWRVWTAVTRESRDLEEEFRTVLEQPEPVEALYGIIRSAVIRHMGVTASGMSQDELQSSLSTRIGTENAAHITRVWKACQDHRYGKHLLYTSDLADLTRGLPNALRSLEVPARKRGIG